MKFCSNCGAQVVQRVPPGDTLARWVCDQCGEIHYQNPKLVVGAIPEYQDKLLLCRRAIEPRYGYWTLPAGFMENDETVGHAALRETAEEAGALVLLGVNAALGLLCYWLLARGWMGVEYLLFRRGPLTMAPSQLGLFTRSDHYRFVQQGVPSVFLMTGFGGEGRERFTHFLSTNYHQPSDDLSLPFNWEAAARIARRNNLIAREIADAPEAPRWYADSFFGTAFGGGQRRAERPASQGQAAARGAR